MNSIAHILRCLARYTHSIRVVAEREIRSRIQTKGFWFTTLFGPLFIALGLYALVFLFSLISSMLHDSDEDIEEILREVADEFNAADILQDTFWGEPLQFYIVDRTEKLKHNIRQTILSRNNDALLAAHGGSENIPLEDLEYFLKEDSHLARQSNVSYRWFREVEEPNVPKTELREWLESGIISGYFVIPADFLSSTYGTLFVRPQATGHVLSNKLDRLQVWFEDIMTTVRQSTILDQYGIDQASHEQFTNSIDIKVTRTHPNAVSTGEASFPEDARQAPLFSLEIWAKLATIPYVYIFLATLGAAANSVVTSTVEEKSTKVAELLVSRLNPSQIMDGKLLGNGIVMIVGLGLIFLILAPPIILQLFFKSQKYL